MSDYNFWADLLSTYEALPDLIKVLWLIVPPIFVLALVALFMRYKISKMRSGPNYTGDLIYSIRQTDENKFYVFRHGDAKAYPALLPMNKDALIDWAPDTESQKAG